MNAIQNALFNIRYRKDIKRAYEIACSRAAEENKKVEAIAIAEDTNAAENTTPKTEEKVNTDATTVAENKSSKSDNKDKKETKNAEAKTEPNKEKVEVKDNVEAAMSGGGHIKDENPNLINLGGGVVINPDIGSQPPEPEQNFVQQNPMFPNQPMGQQFTNPVISGFPYGYQQFNPMQPQMPPQQQAQPQMQPQMQQPQFESYEYDPTQLSVLLEAAKNAMSPEMYEKYANAIKRMNKNIPGMGNHKVDNPQPKKPEVVKAEPDKVDIDLGEIPATIASNVEEPEQPKKPEIIDNELPKVEVVEPEEPMFDNSSLKNKFRYLDDIENIALSLGCHVEMKERLGMDGNPNGLIDVITYTKSNDGYIQNGLKCFTIDTGMIIDRRAKVYPIILNEGYENYQSYPVLIPRAEGEKEKGKSKSKNTINETLFTSLFTGGVNMLDEKRGMYTPDLLELNKNIALITMPTANMNKETRKATRDRLFNAMKSGVFAEAMKYDAGARFMFKSYDKKTGNFCLTSAGVPKSFGGRYLTRVPVEIYFGIDKTTVTPVQQ